MREKRLSQKQQSGVTRREIADIGIILLGAFIAILNQTVLSPALPKLMQDFDINAGTAQWVTSIYMLVNGIMVPVTAFLIDRFPTRKLFIWSMVSFILGTLLAMVAPNFGVLLVGRVLQAVGAGVQLPLIAVVPMIVFPVEKRGMAMGVAGIVMSAAPAVGPVVAGSLIDAAGWRAMFAAILPVAVIVLIISIVFLTNIGKCKHPHLEVPSVLLSTLAFGGLLYGFSTASNSGWLSVGVIVPLLVGASSLVLFVRRQLRVKEPLLQLRVLKNRQFAVSAVIVTVINSAIAVGSVVLPLFLQNVLGLSALETGIMMTPGAVFTIFLSPVSGMLFDKFGPRVLSIVGLTGLTGSLIALACAGPGSPKSFLICAYIVQSAGITIANMPVNTWGMNALRTDLISHGNAISNTGRQVGGSISTAIIVTIMSMVTAASQRGGTSSLLATANGIHAAYGTAAGVAAVALLIAIVAVKSKKKDSAQAAQNHAAKEAAQ